MLSDWNFWCSIITAIATVAALIMSVHQTRVSNKQHLFDRRLDVYMRTKILLDACEKNYELLYPQNYRENPIYENKKVFCYLTVNTFIDKFSYVISCPGNVQEQEQFVEACYDLKKDAMQMPLIFKGNSAKIYSEFIEAYVLVLLSLYVYELALCGKKLSGIGFTKIGEAEQVLSKDECRKQVQETMENLKNKFDAAILPEVEKEIQNQLSII